MKKILLFVLVCVVLALVIVMRSAREDISSPDPVSVPEKVQLPPLFGVNIGHWLSDELQFGHDRFDCDRPMALESLQARFGAEVADEILDIYRNGFLTDEDFATIRNIGFNAVRLPVSAALLYDKPGSTSRFDRTASQIEWFLQQAEANNLAVVLNICIRPGQWAAQPPIKGKRFAAVWSPRDVEEVTRLWSMVASRFRDGKSLVGYDLSPGPCQANEDWDDVLLAWHAAIMAQDNTRLIYAPWRRSAVERLARISQHSDKNTGFSVDFLADGISRGTSGTEVRLAVDQDIPRMNEFWKNQQLGIMVTAYNPLVVDASDSSWLGTYREAFRSSGWASFLWTYKSIQSNAEGTASFDLYTNRDMVVIPNLSNDTREAIEDVMREISAVEFFANEMVLDALQSKSSGNRAMKSDKVEAANKNTELPEGWKIFTCGSVEHEIIRTGTNHVVMVSSGLGPESVTPEFTGIYREAVGASDISVALADLELNSKLAGAGIMVRESLEMQSPFLLVYRSVEGSVRAVLSNEDGQPRMQRKFKNSEDAHFLRIIGDGKVLKASCSTDGISWPVAENFSAPWITNKYYAVYVVFSGHEYRTAKATFENMNFQNSVTP